MITNFVLFLGSGFILLWFFKNIPKHGILLTAKGSLQIGLVILFIGGFLRLFVNLPPNIYIKLLFSFIYIWCTVGVNVNFMIPLVDLIDRKIDKYK